LAKDTWDEPLSENLREEAIEVFEEYVCFVPYWGLDVPQTKQQITWWEGSKSCKTHSMRSYAQRQRCIYV